MKISDNKDMAILNNNSEEKSEYPEEFKLKRRDVRIMNY